MVLGSVWWKSLCSETAWYRTDTSVVLIPTPTKLCCSSVVSKQLSHHHRDLEALQQVWIQHRCAASWKLLCWAAPPWQREGVGSAIDVLVTLERSCSFPVPKQPFLLKQAASWYLWPWQRRNAWAPFSPHTNKFQRVDLTSLSNLFPPPFTWKKLQARLLWNSYPK